MDRTDETVAAAIAGEESAFAVLAFATPTTRRPGSIGVYAMRQRVASTTERWSVETTAGLPPRQQMAAHHVTALLGRRSAP
jgi:hypothetical protein